MNARIEVPHLQRSKLVADRATVKGGNLLVTEINSRLAEVPGLSAAMDSTSGLLPSR